MKLLPSEIWLDIPGFEGLYQVSNMGNVKALPKSYVTGFGGTLHQPERILGKRKQKNVENYYEQVDLSKSGVKRTYYVHYLVALAFIPNPHGYPCVNHKDECKHNNICNNLEWVSYSMNLRYGTLPDRFHKKRINRKDMSKPVKQLTLDGKLLYVFPSTMEAERLTGIRSQNIGQCCLGRLKQVRGYRWEYYNE